MGSQCYLPSRRGDIPTLPQPINAGTRFSDPRGMQGWVDLVLGTVVLRKFNTVCLLNILLLLMMIVSQITYFAISVSYNTTLRPHRQAVESRRASIKECYSPHHTECRGVCSIWRHPWQLPSRFPPHLLPSCPSPSLPLPFLSFPLRRLPPHCS